MLVADRLIRPMRGRSRSVHLAAGGWHFVVKPPCIGPKALLSEWLGARLLSMLGILAADVQPILVPARLAAACWPGQGYRQDVVAAASAYPVDPERRAVYDLLPPALELANADHLAGVLAADLWTGRREPRQHVFYRQGPWWACAIDHKDSFGLGSDALLQQPANPVLRAAYARLLDEEQVEFWLEKIGSVRLPVLEDLLDLAPEAWREAAAVGELRQRLARLLDRRQAAARQLRSIVRSSAGLPPCRAIA